MSKVALIFCDSYDTSQVNDAVKKGIDLLGGIQSFVQPGETVLLKPNLVAADPPERCSTDVDESAIPVSGAVTPSGRLLPGANP